MDHTSHSPPTEDEYMKGMELKRKKKYIQKGITVDQLLKILTRSLGCQLRKVTPYFVWE